MRDNAPALGHACTLPVRLRSSFANALRLRAGELGFLIISKEGDNFLFRRIFFALQYVLILSCR